MRISYLKLIVFLAGVMSIASCRKDKPEEIKLPPPTISANGGVYIINEGNYLFGNASVSYYDFSSSSVTQDLFQPANGHSLGDVCQSMCFFNNKAYVVVNNSQKIEIVNPQSFISSAAISTGLLSPRYFLPVSNSKAYVTDLYANAISIVNLSTNSVSGSIPCNGWTEELVLAYGKAFVTDLHSDKIYVINTSTDLIEDSISVAYGPNSIREDANGKLWVLCDGKQSAGIYPALVRINPIDNHVEQTIQFSNLTDTPNKLEINGTLDKLYYLSNGGVYTFSITSGSLSSTALIAEGSSKFYGLGVDPTDETIYVADAIDYVQHGVVLRYHSNGSFINSFTVGIIPNHFYFN